MIDELRELTQFRADPPPADPAAMSRARAELVRHATTGRPRRPRWRLPTMIAASAAVAAGLLILPATRDSAPAAYAVTANPDGSVTIALRDLSELDLANKELRELGVPIVLVPRQPRCDSAPELQSVVALPDGLFAPILPDRQNVVTVRPNEIPADTQLFVLAEVDAPQPRSTVSVLVPEESTLCYVETVPTK